MQKEVLPLETKQRSLAHDDSGDNVVHDVARNNVKVQYLYSC